MPALYTVNSDESITVIANNTTDWSNIPETILQPGTYICSRTNAKGAVAIRDITANQGIGYMADGVLTSDAFTVVEGHVIKVRIGTDTQYPFTTKLQLESGSTATAWSPYSNECPISGWTGCEVWDDPKYDKTINFNQLARGKANYSQNYITSVFDSDTGIYTLSGTASASYTANIESCIVVEGHKYYQGLNVITNPNNESFAVGSLNGRVYPVDTSEIEAIRECSGSQSVTVGVQRLSVGDVTDGIKFQYILVDLTQMFGEGNEPSTVDEFKTLFPKNFYPYNAGEETCVSAVNGDPYRHVEVTWEDEAGTVYGGNINLTTGVLTALYNIVDMGDLEWKYFSDASTYFFVCNAPSGIVPITVNTDRADIKCSIYGVRALLEDGFSNSDAVIAQTQKTFRARDSRYTTANEFISAVTGQEIVYPLATPVTYQLDPETIETLKGKNTIWADTNGDVTVSYLASKPRFSFKSPLGRYSYETLKVFNATFIEKRKL